jgi:hypothetical protein
MSYLIAVGSTSAICGDEEWNSMDVRRLSIIE